MLLVTITRTLPASLWSLWARGGALVQGAPEGQGHPCGWQVAGTEPADTYGPLYT